MYVYFITKTKPKKNTKKFRHGSWMKATKIQGFLTIAILKSSFHWTDWQVTIHKTLSL